MEDFKSVSEEEEEEECIRTYFRYKLQQQLLLLLILSYTSPRKVSSRKNRCRFKRELIFGP